MEAWKGGKAQGEEIFGEGWLGEKLNYGGGGGGQTVMTDIGIVSVIFKDHVVQQLQLYTTPTDRLTSMYQSFYRQVRSLKEDNTRESRFSYDKQQ